MARGDVSVPRIHENDGVSRGRHRDDRHCRLHLPFLSKCVYSKKSALKKSCDCSFLFWIKKQSAFDCVKILIEGITG